MYELNDYDFNVPKELIAVKPLANRSSSRLLRVTKDEVEHKNFHDLVNYLEEGSVLVVNNTKVIKARFFVYKKTSALIEIFLLGKENNFYKVLIRNLGKHNQLFFDLKDDKNYIQIHEKLADNSYLVSSSIDLLEYANKNGSIPLPPYIDRDACDEDEHNYQTIFAQDEHAKAVAAPTASLHFDDEIITKLKNKGVVIAQITLHVGLGTFFPIRSENINEHTMHEEHFIMDNECADLLNAAKLHKRKIIAVGTTSLRTLEQVALLGSQKNKEQPFFACDAKTSLFIKPSFKFLAADALITNFHLPKSTLFILVSTILGRQRALDIYQEAIEKKYRFFSYGDACYLDINRE